MSTRPTRELEELLDLYEGEHLATRDFIAMARVLLARLRTAWHIQEEVAEVINEQNVEIRGLDRIVKALRADLQLAQARIRELELNELALGAEEWRTIKGFEGRYEVSDLGRVRSLPRRLIPKARILSPIRNKDGYDSVMFRKDKKCYHFFVQRLVLEAFVGPCPPGHEAAHQDGNPVNCALTNLRWATHIDNARQKNQHGTVFRKCAACGERHKAGQCALARPGVQVEMKK